jgi:hypothetical protein
MRQALSSLPKQDSTQETRSDCSRWIAIYRNARNESWDDSDFQGRTGHPGLSHRDRRRKHRHTGLHIQTNNVIPPKIGELL